MKINLKKLACFPAPKYYLRLTTFTTHFTITSPRFTTFCTPEYPKTPAKQHPHHGQLNPTQFGDPTGI
jgi:hypothetical protein